MPAALSWLPLVRRELSVAVRRRTVYQVRVLVVALAIGAGFFSLLFGMGFWGAGQQGKLVFTFLSGYAYAVSLLAGVFLASDALSQEKREGTLGLLFLTDLRGHDVVLGKLVACSINALCGLVALLPVIALPIMMGGVTAGEFWRSALSLVNALFYSLATGLTISAFSKEGGRSAARSLGVLLVLGLGWPWAMWAAGGLGVPLVGGLAWLSPLAPFRLSEAALYAADPGGYWVGLLVSHAVAWLFLGIASYQLPAMVREGGGAAQVPAWKVRRAGRGEARVTSGQSSVISDQSSVISHQSSVNSEGRGVGGGRRGRVDEAMPVSWLVGQDSGSQRLAWGLVLVWGVVASALAYSSAGTALPVLYGGKIFALLLKFLAALYATQFFLQCRQTGMLDSLAATPLETSDLVRAQWHGYRQTFLAPLVVFLGIQALPVLHVMWFGGQRVVEHVWTITGMSSGVFLWLWVSCSILLDFGALFYFGVWTALSMKQPRYATLATVVGVLLLPGFAFCSIFPMFSFCGADMLASLWFISWSRRRLAEDFRRCLVRE